MRASHTPDGVPRFGARGRAWMLRRLLAELPTHMQPPPSADRLASVARWYAERWREYVEWVDREDYAGPGYSLGVWQIRWSTVTTDLSFAERLAADARALANDAERFPTLDAWLDAERAGKLAHRGAREPDAEGLLDDAPARALADARRRVRRAVGRVCVACHDTFPPERNAKRCPTCRAGGRAPLPPEPAPDAPSARGAV